MERTLFDWCHWDQLDAGVLQFIGCTLKVPIGTFAAGELVPVIVVSFEAGDMQLIAKDGSLISEHNIRLTLDN
jgi:hypothetical protein